MRLVVVLVSQPFWALPSQSPVPAPHATQAPPAQVWAVEHAVVVHVFPQLLSTFTAFSQPFDGAPSHSRVPVPQGTHAPFAQVCVLAAQAAAAPQEPVEEHV